MEYGFISLEVFSQDTFVSVGCDDVNLVTFAYELLTGDSFHNLLHCVWLFNTNDDKTNIGYLY